MFAAAGAVVGHMRGGLACSVIGACTIFGAICGSSVATTATFGRAALPELRRYGYEPGFATGTIAIGGVVDRLIPPSIILVVYAIVTEQNIAKLFQAALIPGLIAVALYCVVIALVVRWKPALAPTMEKMGRRERIRSLIGVWPAILIILMVIGGIYIGIFTPTEAAAVGTVAMLLVGLMQRSLSWADFKLSPVQTAETSAMIFAILLGAVMDELAMLLLTLPVFFPIVAKLLSPAKGERFIARGRVVRPGKKLMVCLGEVFAEEAGTRKQVALMTASMMVMDTSTGLRD